MDPSKESVKGLGPCSPVPPPVSDCLEPMDTSSDTTKANDTEAPVAKIKDEKPSSPKSKTSDSSPSCSSSSNPAPPSVDIKQEEQSAERNIKKEKNNKENVKKGAVVEEKMDIDLNVEMKKEKADDGKATKPSRPSSTPPSSTGMWVQSVSHSLQTFGYLLIFANIEQREMNQKQ